MNKLIKLHERTGDARSCGVEDALLTALDDIRSGKRVANKVAVLFLNDAGENYRVGFQQAGFCMSELVALLAVLQHSIIGEDMGFNMTRE